MCEVGNRGGLYSFVRNISSRQKRLAVVRVVAQEPVSLRIEGCYGEIVRTIFRNEQLNATVVYKRARRRFPGAPSSTTNEEVGGRSFHLIIVTAPLMHHLASAQNSSFAACIPPCIILVH